MSNISDKLLKVFHNRFSYSIKQSDIDYIMAYNGYSVIYQGNSSYRRDVSLVNLISELDDGLFVQINRKYVINIKKITHYEVDRVYIKHIDFRISKNFRRAFDEFYLAHL